MCSNTYTNVRYIGKYIVYMFLYFVKSVKCLIWILQWFQSDLCNDLNMVIIILIQLFAIIPFSCFEYDTSPSAHSSKLFSSSIQLKTTKIGKRKAPKYRLVYTTPVQHQKRWTQIFKSAISFNPIHFRCCTHPDKWVIRTRTCRYWRLRFWSFCCNNILKFWHE